MTGRQSLARNVVSNWLVLAVSGVYALAITPFVVRTLDTELYGVWSFLNGLLAYAEMFYLDLGVAYIKYVAQFLARDDRPAIKRLMRVIATLYFAKGAAAFALLLWLGAVLPDVFAEPLSAGATAAVPLTCALLGVRVWLMFIATVYSGLLCGYDRFDLVNGVHLSALVARLIATPLLLQRGHDPLLTMAWISAGMGAVEAIALGIVAERHVGGITIRPARPTRFELGRLYGFGLQSAFVLLAIKLINYTDTTVIGITLGAASVAMFALPLQLVEFARLAVGGFVGVLLPRVEKLTLGQDATTGVRETFVKTARVGCLLTGWLAALLIAIGPSFLTRWVGPEYGGSAQWLLVYLSVAMFAQALSVQVPLPFYQAMHVLRVPGIVLGVEAGLNLALSLWLAPRMGLTGVALATAIPALTIGLIVLPRYLCRTLGLPLSTWLRQSVLPGVLMFIATLSSQMALGVLLDSDSYTTIAFRLLSTMPVALAVVHWTFPADERPERPRAHPRSRHLPRAYGQQLE